LFSFIPEVQLGTEAVQGVRKLRKVQGCEPERESEGLLLQVCAESKSFNTQTELKGCRKECTQGSSLKDLKVMGKAQEGQTFEFVGEQ
jgi:hypothetical protein